MVWIIIIATLVPFALSVAATYWVRGWSRRRGFVDNPGGHKTHDTPVALGGGIAIVLATCGPILLGSLAAWLLNTSTPPAWIPNAVRMHIPGITSRLPMVLGVVGGALALHAVGLIDDRRALGVAPKLAVQVVVALFTAWILGIRVIEAVPGPVSIIVTVLWIVLITNAFNFLDNMDGLSAGVAVIAAAVFAITSARAGQVFIPTMAWVIVGALLGFLLFNFSPATIFMGDAGSLVVGYLMSVVTIMTDFYDGASDVTPLGVLVPLVVLAVPLYDVGSVVIHRLYAGESPFHGDARHFSHRLVKRGMTARGAVLTIYLATAATGIPAVVLARIDWVGALLLLIQCLCVVTMIAVLEKARPADKN